jgi:hypothetical protein
LARASPTLHPTETPISSPTPTLQATVTPLPSATNTTKAIQASSAKENGPQNGVSAPDFSLPNAHGGTFTLSDLYGKQSAVLVFYRTAG